MRLSRLAHVSICAISIVEIASGAFVSSSCTVALKTPLPAPPYHCGGQGHLGPSAQSHSLGSSNQSSPEGCHDACFAKAGCQSFGFATKTSICSLYDATIDTMKFFKSNSGVSYYNKRCFYNCAPAASSSFCSSYLGQHPTTRVLSSYTTDVSTDLETFTVTETIAAPPVSSTTTFLTTTTALAVSYDATTTTTSTYTYPFGSMHYVSSAATTGYFPTQCSSGPVSNKRRRELVERAATCNMPRTLSQQSPDQITSACNCIGIPESTTTSTDDISTTTVTTDIVQATVSTTITSTNFVTVSSTVKTTSTTDETTTATSRTRVFQYTTTVTYKVPEPSSIAKFYLYNRNSNQPISIFPSINTPNATLIDGPTTNPAVFTIDNNGQLRDASGAVYYLAANTLQLVLNPTVQTVGYSVYNYGCILAYNNGQFSISDTTSFDNNAAGHKVSAVALSGAGPIYNLGIQAL